MDLIRRLVDESVGFHSNGRDGRDGGITLALHGGPRSFSWLQSCFWSRDPAREYSTASGFVALEAWAHGRVDADEDVAKVIDDVLGPTAPLLVAVDLLISHWPAIRVLLVPFVGNVELLPIDRHRLIHDQMQNAPGWT